MKRNAVNKQSTIDNIYSILISAFRKRWKIKVRTDSNLSTPINLYHNTDFYEKKNKNQ